MLIVDFIFLSLTIFSSLLGLSRGFVKEFLSLTKWLVSIYISYISFEKAKIVLSSFLKDTTILDLIAAATIFILVFIILTIIFNFLSKILSIKGMDFINKTLGFFFGFLRMILIFSLLFIIYQIYLFLIVYYLCYKVMSELVVNGGKKSINFEANFTFDRM